MIRVLRNHTALDFIVDIKRRDVLKSLQENEGKEIIMFLKSDKVIKMVDLLKIDDTWKAWKDFVICIVKYQTGEIDLMVSTSKTEIKDRITESKEVIKGISEDLLKGAFKQLREI